jgi:hypothetical protein
MQVENEFFDKARTVAKQIDAGTYVYTPASTDITIRWRKLYGYVPASEQARYQKKWADFRALTNKTLNDVEIPLELGVIKWQKRSKY